MKFIKNVERILSVAMALVAIIGFCSNSQAGESPALIVNSPQDFQVFQRRTSKEGTIAVEGDLRGGSKVEVQLDAGPWQAATTQAHGRFATTISTRAGGWFKLQLRLMEGGKEVAHAAIDHVGVGEVFIVAGQSNSSNYGSEKQRTATGRVVCFDGAHWALANDPERGADGNGGSFMPAFGDALAQRFDVPIAVVPCGIGATSVREWLPKGSIMTNEPTTGGHVKKVAPGKWEATGEPFEGLMKRAEALGPHGFRAILWHQGESDAGQAREGYPQEKQITGKQYTKFMEQLIHAARDRAKWEMPWFTAQATYHSTKDAADAEFRAAQKAPWDSGLALQGPDTDALGEEYRAGVHFNGKGLAAHGGLWAGKIAEYLDASGRAGAGEPKPSN